MTLLDQRVAKPGELPGFVAALTGLVARARRFARLVDGIAPETDPSTSPDAGRDGTPSAPPGHPTAFVFAVAGLVALHRQLDATLTDQGVSLAAPPPGRSTPEAAAVFDELLHLDLRR